MQSLVDAGLTRADVLRSATLEAANYLRGPGRFGEIREGALEAEFATAPPMPPEAGARSDFLSDSGSAASVTSGRSDDGTMVTAAMRDNAGRIR